MASVIVGGARTGMGKMMGALKDFSAMDLGGIAIKGALDKAGVSGNDVDYVIMGHVIQAGCGQMTARQAAVKGGIPMQVPALTVNKVCLSGIAAIALADQLIRAGECDIVVAGGMESMTQAPHYLPKSRSGYKYGDVVMKDAMAFDGLWDVFTDQAMGLLTETANAGAITRQEQDAFGMRSHQRAAAAQTAGIFDDEIVPVQIPQRKGNLIEFATDEGVRGDTSMESLAALRPAFDKNGTITAGQSSPISDGACALVIMSEEKAAELGLTVIAKIGAYGNVAGPDSTLQIQPANAIKAACKKQGISVSQLDVIEINEAFAAVGIASARELGMTETDIDQKVNIHGGAIATGHPLGMSGARVVLHAALELQRRGSGTAAVALCGGGGQGDAVILTR
ncbi:MAG: acetyl-CoA C-acetyltransferase [Propionibacteriaceae bacterium]